MVQKQQVIEVVDGAEPREQRISLSMKLVDQSTGADLDPSNAEAETDVGTTQQRGGRLKIFVFVVFLVVCESAFDFFHGGGGKVVLRIIFMERKTSHIYIQVSTLANL